MLLKLLKKCQKLCYFDTSRNRLVQGSSQIRQKVWPLETCTITTTVYHPCTRGLSPDIQNAAPPVDKVKYVVIALVDRRS